MNAPTAHALLTAALLGLLGWFGLLIVAGAVTEYRRARRDRRRS